MASRLKDPKNRRRRGDPMPVQTPVPPPEPRDLAPPNRNNNGLSIFEAAGLKVERASKDPTEPWRIADRFNWWPLSARWSEGDVHPLARLDSGRQGYGAASLMMLIRNEATHPAAVAAVAEALDPVRAPPAEQVPS